MVPVRLRTVGLRHVRSNEWLILTIATTLVCAGSAIAFYSIAVLVLGAPLVVAVAATPVIVSGLLLPDRRPQRLDQRESEESRPTIVEALTARLRPIADRQLCVCVPTYNEAKNVRPFVRALLAIFDAARVDGTVLVIDDDSPDGTGAIADKLAAKDARVHVLHRPQKDGLGRAYQAGFRWAMARDYELIAQMDCDFSHDPRSLPALVAVARETGFAIGSRYVEGGSVADWPRSRRLVSRFGSWYARLVLGISVRDLTGGFKCFRSDVLELVDQGVARSKGYAFQIELTQRIVAAGVDPVEIPIAFRDRSAGESKMTLAIAAEAALVVVGLRWRRDSARLRIWLRAHPARPVLTALVAGIAYLAVLAPLTTLELLLVLLFLALTFVGVTTLSWMLDAWRDAYSIDATGFPEPSTEPRRSFSLILPARHEERVLGATLAQLALQDYPDFEVVVVVGHDDDGTRRVALDAIGDDPRFRVITDHNEVKNKPKALNTALPECEGDVVAVFDAEDIVATGLLRVVDAAFEQSGADVVQGATQLMNHRSTWFSARNALEYYFWFKSRLHLHSRIGFIPLGGNTVFVRRPLLNAVDGWDDDCLAEDCDLGARLSARGATTSVAYTAALATREETPENLAALIRQRTRWSQGYLQVLRKGDWRVLPPRARALAAYTLAFPFLQAGSCVILPFAIASIILLHLPIELALLSFVPVAPLIAILAVEVVGLHSLRGEFGLRVRTTDHLRLVVGAIPYQLVLSIAAAHAAWRELRGIRTWEKTAHVGAHL
jgi:cellulose synthase/poly-beta-1,6-N-acetylglucosamine synthase-like glycosyltransferase